MTVILKRFCLVVVGVMVLGLFGCFKQPKEVPASVKAEAATYASEAQFAMQVHEYSRAEESIQRAIKLRDDVPEYWVTLGMARRKQDNKSGAAKAYKIALGLHEERYEAEHMPEEISQQAFVSALLGRVDEAKALLELGLKNHPESELMKRMASPRGLIRTFQTREFQELSL